MNVHVRPDDERRIEVLAQDLPCFGGTQLAVDITVRSALGSSGEPRPRAADIDGAVLAQARIDKETTYPEWWQLTLAGGGARKPCSSFGSWRKQKHANPCFLAHQVALAWERRWTRRLSVACASSFAASLVEPTTRELSCQTGGNLPTTADILVHDPS